MGVHGLEMSAYSVAAALASRLGLTVLVGAFSLVTTPLLLGSLGVEGYGVYALIVGIPALLPFLDAGLGALVTQSVADAAGRNDLRSAHRSISAAVALLSAVALALLAATLAAGFLVDWSGVLGISTVPEEAVRISVIVTLVGLCLALPLSVGARVLVGLKKSHVATILGGFLGAVLGLAGIAAAAGADAPLWGFVAAQAVSAVLGAAACTAWVRRRQCVALRFDRSTIGLEPMRRTAAAALAFVLMTIAPPVA
jgi:O-antigen/teichoic acid export membrane protein